MFTTIVFQIFCRKIFHNKIFWKIKGAIFWKKLVLMMVQKCKLKKVCLLVYDLVSIITIFHIFCWLALICPSCLLWLEVCFSLPLTHFPLRFYFLQNRGLQIVHILGFVGRDNIEGIFFSCF